MLARLQAQRRLFRSDAGIALRKAHLADKRPTALHPINETEPGSALGPGADRRRLVKEKLVLGQSRVRNLRVLRPFVVLKRPQQFP